MTDTALQSHAPRPTITGMTRSRSEPVVVAAGQLQSRLMNEAAATLDSIATLIVQAADSGARLLVLPECAYPAYLLGSVESYRTGDHLSSRAFLDWLGARAAKHRLHIVSGYVEDTGEALYNSAILLGPEGRPLANVRKRFLWNVDQDWFCPGQEIAACQTAIGRIGIIICAETRVPEILATQVADGVELFAMPTCWINNARQPGEYRNPQPEFLIEARSREFGVPFVCADKSGMELTAGYVGQSCIVTPDEGMVTKAPYTGEALVVSEITPRRPNRIWAADSRRSRLLSEEPATKPDRQERCELTVAAISTAMFEARFTGDKGEQLFKPLADEGVRLLVANVPHEAHAERMSLLARAFDVEAIGFPLRPDVFTQAGARVGCMAGQWLRSFAAGRALALDGAEIITCFDEAGDLSMLRTRALENRVFVVGVAAEASVIIGPDAGILARGTADMPAVARIDLAQASDKIVAPRTDVFAQRRPKFYRF